MEQNVFWNAWKYLFPQAPLTDRPHLEEFKQYSPKYKDYVGIITVLDKDEGVIDNSIYFTQKDEASVLSVGTEVYGKAYQNNPQDSWRATTVYLVSKDKAPERQEWDEAVEELVELPKIVIEKVVSVQGDLVTTQSRLTFKVTKLVCDVSLTPGDWVRFERNEEDWKKPILKSSVIEVNKAEPNRVKTVYGFISAKAKGLYVINNDIVCENTIFLEQPNMNQRVLVKVIESDQIHFNWRAIEGVVNEDRTASNVSYALDEQIMTGPTKSSIAPELLDQMNNRDISLNDDPTIVIHVPKRFTLADKNSSDVIPMHIRNMGANSITVHNVWFIPINGCTHLDFSCFLHCQMPLVLEKNSDATIPLICSSKQTGEFVEKIIFQIDAKFFGRQLLLDVKEPSLPKAHLSKFNIQRAIEQTILSGQRQKKPLRFTAPRLPSFTIPDKLWKNVDQGRVLEAYPILQQPLCATNYVDKLSLLVHLEEVNSVIDMMQYDMKDVVLSKHGAFLVLNVPGLAEKRPSVLMGDSIVSWSYDFGPSIKYEGCVHEIRGTNVYLKFMTNFHEAYNQGLLNVEFKQSRGLFRRLHHSLSLVVSQLGASVLFPIRLRYSAPQVCFVEDTDPVETLDIENLSLNEGCKPCKEEIVKKLTWFNAQLNEEQKTTVRRIIEGVTRPLPYIIFGPPGTGKTVTVVESILQTYVLLPHSRSLVVAPSNSACDLLMQRLLQWNCIAAEDIIRINAFNRHINTIPEDIRAYCHDRGDIQCAARRRVILCTSTAAAQLYNASLKPDHFSHLYIDEAGQMIEPETCIPFGLSDWESGQIILAGDPKQLGPTVRSQIAKRYGLNSSLLQRLCSSVLYQPKRELASTNGSISNIDFLSTTDVSYDEKLVTQLVQNYRSHPDILEIPSKLFYFSMLKSVVPTELANSLLSWPELPNPKCPLIMHGVMGTNEKRESTSWFNLEEAHLAASYASKLVIFGVKTEDIGIITPYRKQVDKIRCALKLYNMEGDIKVASVEEFQGQEKRVIILSTVRSSQNHFQEDRKFSLGFVSCPERFNVAITRAKCLLVVISNPILLQTDCNWKEFLTFCINKGAYKGVPLQTNEPTTDPGFVKE